MATTYKPEDGKSITILCGKPSFVGISPTDSRVAQLHDSGFTLFYVGVKNGPTLAIMGIASITVHVLSGDTRPAVEKLCRDLGISCYSAETSPEGKNEYIEALKSSGSKVLFCGDGANDAIALAQADIGLSMTKEGFTVAAADACILNNEVSGVINLLDLSKQINRRVIVGISWVCVYNFFAVLTVSGAFVNVRIGPAWAGVSEDISILPVIAIALSMKWTSWRKPSGSRFSSSPLI
ncbi:HAD-like domain-containing protein [Lipomyces mesembrius]